MKHKHYYCIRAYADGWKIEYLASSNNKWYPSEYPEFAKNLAYRVVPDEDGWLPWYGGECPINPNVMVAVKYQGGGTCTQTAGKLRWRNNTSIYAYVTAYRIVEEEKTDPYAELKAAAKDPTKQIRCGKTGAWGKAGTAWTFERPVQDYEIRNKPKKMKLLAWVEANGNLNWRKEGYEYGPYWARIWKRVPSEDKEIEVEE